MERNLSLWQEISYCGKKFLSVARHFFKMKMSVCDNTFALKNHFFLQETICLTGTFCFILQKTLSCLLTKGREFLPTFRVSLKISWEPGSLAPGEYPTLVPTLWILNVGTVTTLCILNVGTVPKLCILNVGTVPTFSPSELVHLNDLHYLSLQRGPPQ